MWLTYCRSLDQFAFKGQIGAGHASIVYLVRDKVADTNLALKCYPGAAAKPDVRVQVWLTSTIRSLCCMRAVVVAISSTSSACNMRRDS